MAGGVSGGVPSGPGGGLNPGDTGYGLTALRNPGIPSPDSVSPPLRFKSVKRVAATDLEGLRKELIHPKQLGDRVILWNSVAAFGLEEFVPKLGTDPASPAAFTPDITKRMIAGGLLPLIERQRAGAAEGDREILIGVRAQSSKDGSLKDCNTLALPIIDNFLPWAKLAGIESRVTFVLMNSSDYAQLEELRASDEARRKFMKQLDPEKSARSTFMEIVEKAIARGASDIHIEPLSQHEAQIRYRIDGVLEADATSIKRAYAEGLVNVVKVIAELDITERRRPQDGSITFKKDELLRGFLRDDERQQLDAAELRERFSFLKGKSLRISTLPTPNGESCAIRILKSAESSQLKISDLGFPAPLLSRLRTLLNAPNGVLLVAGPTGSGKTTTLAAGLAELNTPDVKIITVEDPVEQEQRGVTQTQVRADIDYKFSDALRSILRHDPDIVLVGEVRDDETAQIMIQGANTGHLMLSTIHTNDSISVLKRLRDLGVEEFQIQDSLLGVLSQRLTRKLCSGCKVAYDGRAALNELFQRPVFEVPKEPRSDPMKDPEAIVLYKPGPREVVCACRQCNGKGYKGRIAVPELWVIGQEEKDLVSRGEHGHTAFYDAALRSGMVPMSIQGFTYALEGVTDLSELRAVITPSELIHRVQMFKEFFAKNTVAARGKG